MRYALEGIIHAAGQVAVESGLRRGFSLTEILTSASMDAEEVLQAVYLQIKYTKPASLCIHLEPAPRKEILILDPYDLFFICPRFMTKSAPPTLLQRNTSDS